MKKKEVGLRPQRKLKGFECSSHGRHLVRYAKMPSSSKRKKEEKKEKEANFTNFQKEPWVCLLFVLYMTKKEQKENVHEKGLTRIRTGVTRSFSISVHCRTFSKSGMLTTTS